MNRLTTITAYGTALRLDNPQNDEEAREQLMAKYKIAIGRLAVYENMTALLIGTLAAHEALEEKCRGDSPTERSLYAIGRCQGRIDLLRDILAMVDAPQRALTNEDRVRAMSNEELAIALMCPDEAGTAEMNCTHGDNKDCYQCLFDWLGQPMAVSGGTA